MKKAFISIFAIFFSAIIISTVTALYVLLVKQIEILGLDSASFQSLYMADSAFECVLYKEQNTTSNESIFQPSHSGELGNCLVAGDATWVSAPVVVSGRSSSTLNVSMNTPLGSFCAQITTGKQINDSQIPNSMFISGQNKACTDPVTKVIERLVEFYY